MPQFEVGQVLVVLGFLGVLMGVQFYVRRNRDSLRMRLAAKSRLQVIETVAIGAGERLLLVSIDGQDCVVHSARSGSALIVLNKRMEEDQCAAR
jgi:flagellar biogenesis protein FliO